jgi:DNA-binding CsgD family transcriptional regulator
MAAKKRTKQDGELYADVIERNLSVVEMRKQGSTYAEIADVHGISPSRVAQILSTEERIDRYIKMHGRYIPSHQQFYGARKLKRK